mgnify:CR=1 FL=1
MLGEHAGEILGELGYSDREVAALRAIRGALPTVRRVAAERITAFLMTDFGQRIYRIAVAEAETFPALAQEFYEFGPQRIRDRLAHYLRCAQGRGEVEIADIDLAAAQFAQLCKADLQDRLIFGTQPPCTPADAARVIDGAVAMFMARYGQPGRRV